MRPLLSTRELMSRLGQRSPPVLLDVRWRMLGPPTRQDYADGHLPGAVFVDLDAELAAPPGPGGRHPLPEPDRLQGVLRRAGVDGDRGVVAYDADDGSAAARAWWLLRWAGHELPQVLDGGYAAWVRDGFPVTTEVPTPAEGDFEVRTGMMPVVDADGAAEIARAGRLLDARAPERYRGAAEPVDAQAGHVPGALNAPFREHVDGSGKWRSPEDLAERFAGLGLDGSAPVAAYCGSGVTACSVVLALEQAGASTRQRPASLYPGSWSEWSADPGRPVRTGDEPG